MPWRCIGGVEVQLYTFLFSALDESVWSASCPGLFTPRTRALNTHWLKGWVFPTVGLFTGLSCKDNESWSSSLQPSHDTDWAAPAPSLNNYNFIFVWSCYISLTLINIYEFTLSSSNQSFHHIHSPCSPPSINLSTQPSKFAHCWLLV